MSPWSYDSLAEVYATDMGSSMPFDDIGWYIEQSRGRRTLELGCGTGRILLPLLEAGIDAIGCDRSLPMLVELRRQARQRGLGASVAQADLLALPINATFDCILAPYALITYVRDSAALHSLLTRLSPLLADRGHLIVDSFVPQPVVGFTHFRQDYRRPHGEGWLERSKRITTLDDGRNRIERRYRLLDGVEKMEREWTTCEEIRPYGEDEVRAIAAASGLRVISATADYGEKRDDDSARFWSLVLEKD
ncbi:MAG: class I SAM-dependent methyltransferase [Dokdonella sp.]